uniref:FAM192A/Fyv6 N-terminal domain-containing protein n=1 Tax=Periophthalmus magnuspinnatus TaxID=409849 RepID=A0A3B4AJP9_9GOBI
IRGGGTIGVDLSRKFVSESELDERRKKRQEEWEKVRKPDDPEEAPEEVYDPRSLFERLQEQKDKKQEEFEEQFKFKNMVRGLDEDETSFLDEVSRQQSLVEKRRRDEEKLELAIAKHTAVENRREPEKKTTSKQSVGEQRTSHLSQAHLLAGAVKRRSSSQSSDSSKKQKVENASSTTAGMGDAHTEQERGAPVEAGGAERPRGPTSRAPSAPQGATRGVVHLPSAAVCVGVLPGLCNYSGSSDSDSSSDSEGSVDIIMSPYPRQTRAYR